MFSRTNMEITNLLNKMDSKTIPKLLSAQTKPPSSSCILKRIQRLRISSAFPKLFKSFKLSFYKTFISSFFVFVSIFFIFIFIFWIVSSHICSNSKRRSSYFSIFYNKFKVFSSNLIAKLFVK